MGGLPVHAEATPPEVVGDLAAESDGGPTNNWCEIRWFQPRVEWQGAIRPGALDRNHHVAVGGDLRPRGQDDDEGTSLLFSAANSDCDLERRSMLERSC